jgi:hypothetical protein
MYFVRSCTVALLIMGSPASAQEQRTPGGDCAGLEENSAIAAIRGCHGEFVDPAEAALLGEGPVTGPPFYSDEPYDVMGGEAWAPPGLPPAPALPEKVGGTLPLLPLAAPTARLVQIDGETWATDQQRDRTAVRDATELRAREDSWRAPPRLLPLTPVAEPHIEVGGQVVLMDDWLKKSPLDTRADHVDVDAPEEEVASAVPLPTEIIHSTVIDGVTVELDAASYLLLELILRSAAVPDAEEAQTIQSGAETKLGE